VWALVALLVVLLLLAVVPGAVRVRRRRVRLHAARAGPDPLWAELADTAVDLGYVWSPVRSPRQVEGWLRQQGVSGPEAEAALHSLATAVERSRYAPPNAVDGPSAGLVTDLHQIESSLRARRTRADRVRARVLPGSIGWVRRLLRRH
jgi:hypothetical protein